MPTGTPVLVLQACGNMPGESDGWLLDTTIAEQTGISLANVRDSIESLHAEKLVEAARLTDGLKIRATVQGRLFLQQWRPFPRENQAEGAPPPRIKVIPKGLRSYDRDDAEFFLDLLPPPRRSGGLPEIIHFWKRRIERPDPERTFRVGVIYGPSGCGKSSLVKAGLLPRLSHNVLRVYVEATPDQTEAELLEHIRLRCPGLPPRKKLPGAIEALQDGGCLSAGKKLVLVLDQFEQWLVSNRRPKNTDLAKALVHCDEERVRVILVVRDEFLSLTIQFMEAIRIEFRSRLNATRVDLFTQPHAEQVLAAFGRAEGRLQDRLTAEQKAFISETVRSLAFEDGMIIPVRLALFFETFKSRKWTTKTLQEIGVAEGVGVAFLEKTFDSAYADPRLRPHLAAAQAVLGALLPESGSELKRPRRSRQELLEASGYAPHPKLFDELLRILDKELFLITPIDQGGGEAGEDQAAGVAEPHYQLTHDFLVPSLREWRSNKDKRVTDVVNRIIMSEIQDVPTLVEQLGVHRLWADRKLRRILDSTRADSKEHLHASLALLPVDERQVEYLYQRLITSKNSELPVLRAALNPYRDRLIARLWDVLEQSEEKGSHLQAASALALYDPHDPRWRLGSKEHFQASLALVSVNAGHEDIYHCLLEADPSGSPAVRGPVRPYREQLIDRLWNVLERSDDRFLRLWAASALAMHDPESPRWEGVGGRIARAMVTGNAVLLGFWLEALRPVRDKLIGPLAAVFRDRGNPETERSLAMDILADFAGNRPPLLADLLMDADEDQFSSLLKRLIPQGAEAARLFEGELAAQAPEATGTEKDARARRQARAAVALLRLGQADSVWPHFRHSPDPRLRSFLINWLGPYGVDPRAIVAALDETYRAFGPEPEPVGPPIDAVLFHPRTSLRRALLIGLGSYGKECLAPADRRPMVERILDIYSTDPDSGVHSAAEWALRRWEQGDEIKRMEESFRGRDPGDRRWSVNHHGHTLVKIDGPVVFRMGSPAEEPWRFAEDEYQHEKRIGRRFAIATKPVSMLQYRLFRAPASNLEEEYTRRYCPDPDGPQILVSWYDAAAYCNWLSEREGLGDQLCYEPDEKGEFTEGMSLTPDFLDRRGYRLPTEAEWEYACRAGSVTSRFYGDAEDLLGSYAWFLGNSNYQAHPCGLLRPNDLGLFDILGNVLEWVLDEEKAYDANQPEDEVRPTRIMNEPPRMLRGACFTVGPTFVRTAYRVRDRPMNRDDDIGFRLARTLP